MHLINPPPSHSLPPSLLHHSPLPTTTMTSLFPFEGYEKRLELRFQGFRLDIDPLGLRRLLPLSILNQVLSSVQCTIVSAVANPHFDAYILSESSLFVYPHKIIIKTCGTTQLLKAIPSILPHTTALGLRLSFSRYSRGSYIFPDAQPFPHTSFRDEVDYLEKLLPPELCYRKARILNPSGNIRSRHLWHVHTSCCQELLSLLGGTDEITVEVCMTDLDWNLARAFYRAKADIGLTGDEIGGRMTVATGIAEINPRSLVCGFSFGPCGYSMNGLDRDRYSTIHVTPEDGFSYASYECVDTRLTVIADAVASAVRVFGPGVVSVSLCGGEEEADVVLKAVEKAIKPIGMECQSGAAEEFPGAGMITYQTFSAVVARPE